MLPTPTGDPASINIVFTLWPLRGTAVARDGLTLATLVLPPGADNVVFDVRLASHASPPYEMTLTDLVLRQEVWRTTRVTLRFVLRRSRLGGRRHLRRPSDAARLHPRIPGEPPSMWRRRADPSPIRGRSRALLEGSVSGVVTQGLAGALVGRPVDQNVQRRRGRRFQSARPSPRATHDLSGGCSVSQDGVAVLKQRIVGVRRCPEYPSAFEG